MSRVRGNLDLGIQETAALVGELGVPGVVTDLTEPMELQEHRFRLCLWFPH